MNERQLTNGPYGHLLTNIGAWSFDGQWIVYDVRNGDGSIFDGMRIERVHVETGFVEILYESTRGACCGVVTCSPADSRVVFIHGPENPDSEWSYAPHHRRGVLLVPGNGVENLDACQIATPFVPGALRGGSHVHVFSGDGRWVSFTYQDHLLFELDRNSNAVLHDRDQRNIGVSVPVGPVRVNRNHPRNHDGSMFTVLVTKTVDDPRSGSDDISRACEEGWVGVDGYLRPDGTRQRKALAFLGDVATERGTVTEVFLVDLPDDLTIPGDGPLSGTETKRPSPPFGVRQRRLTFTAHKKFPGIGGTTRHWVRSSPDGSNIAFLMRDDDGIVRLWTVSPNGGDLKPWSQNEKDVCSAFTWSPDGQTLAFVADNLVFLATEEKTVRLTEQTADLNAPLPFAVVFSPDGRKVAFQRNVAHADGRRFNQIFVVDVYCETAFD